MEVKEMREQFIKFVDENVDGCGTDVIAIASLIHIFQMVWLKTKKLNVQDTKVL